MCFQGLTLKFSKARAKDLTHLCKRICYTTTVKQPEQESRSSKTPNHRLALLSFLRIIPCSSSTSKENHRMVKVGWDLWMSSCPTPLLQQGHPQPVAQGCVQMGFEHLCRRRLHNFPAQPTPPLSHPHSKKVFPYAQTESPVLQLVPISEVNLNSSIKLVFCLFF